MTRIRKKNKLIVSDPIASFNKIINSASSTKEELQYLCDKLNIKPSPSIVWLKDYHPSLDTSGVIINMGNPILGGTHWVCVYKNTYFDSFGIHPPPEIKTKIYRDIKIQNPQDGKCGLYCVLFIYFAKKNNIEEFYEIFDN